MIISIFGGTVLRPGMEDAEAAAMDRLVPIASSMLGFVSYKYYTGEDGEGDLDRPVHDLLAKHPRAERCAGADPRTPER